DDPNYWASHPERPFLDAAEAAARKWTFAPPEANTRTSVELMFTFRMAAKSAEVAAGDVPAVEGQPKLLTVGGAIRPPQKIFDVAPDYPAAAMAQNVRGIVVVQIRIAVDGSVADAQVVRSIALLDEAAVRAVRQWRFKPTLLNGQPVEVSMI